MSIGVASDGALLMLGTRAEVVMHVVFVAATIPNPLLLRRRRALHFEGMVVSKLHWQNSGILLTA